MHRWTLLALALSMALYWGCTQEVPPPEATPPPPEDLSTWSAPALVQQSAQVRQTPVSEEPKPTPAEKLYDFASGGTYLAPVMVGFPLDILFERGEEIRNYSGGDPELLEQGQQANRWEVKPGASGRDATMRPHLFLRATEPGLKMGLVITTTKRIYYLTCASVKQSPIRAIRWKYADAPQEQPRPVEPSLLPHPDTPRQYHVGYQVATSQPAPQWVPRHIVDDGTKLYIVYPEITLFKSVPLVRKIGPNGPQPVNSRQFLNTVILDELPARVELRVGTGTYAETATITQGQLRTISCPGDPECPVWPAAATHISAR
jgi:type IV secretory pathway VirB9-like protein